jgi:hypothetical protein
MRVRRNVGQAGSSGTIWPPAFIYEAKPSKFDGGHKVSAGGPDGRE